MGKRKFDLESVNERLKAAKVGIAVVQRGDRLSLRGTFPPKPGSGQVKPSQQKIALGVYANPAGFEHAEAKALELGSLLAQKRFSWFALEDSGSTDAEHCSKWVARFKAHWLANEANFEDSTEAELTWNQHYWYPAFKWLPENSRLTADLLTQTVQRWKSNSRSRQIACQRLKKLAEFAGIEIDLKTYQGTYSTKTVAPRDIPTDENIESWILKIPNPGWKRVYGLIAAFGLRPHEAFFCELLDEKTLRVTEGKTGARVTRALHRRWVEEWDLASVEMPQCNGRTHREYGQRVYRQFERYDIPCNPYDLRHAWCIRASIVYRLPVAIAAQMAGHSPTVHTNIYSRWIRDDQASQVYEDLVKHDV